MNRSDTIGALAKALSAAQGEMTFAAKDSKNPFFNSKYADLAAVWAACRGPLSHHGLALVQSVATDQGVGIVETLLTHESGEWISQELRVPLQPMKVDGGKEITAQSIGSGLTYARRYALAAMVGLAQDDDDSNAASGKTAAEPEVVRLSESAFANHQAALEGCSTLEELKAAWFAAVSATKDDRESQSRLLVVKDAMKAKISGKPAPVVNLDAEPA